LGLIPAPVFNEVPIVVLRAKVEGEIARVLARRAFTPSVLEFTV